MASYKVTRRRVLRSIAGTSIAGIMGTTLSACGGDGGDDIDELAIRVDFNHGIASGDPLSSKVIIWTRATPDKPTQRITLQWEMSTDENFSDVVGKGNVLTTADNDYTVKIDVSGLDADTTYYYRFRYGNKYSPTGRTKTLPTGTIDNVRLALISCANYPAGYFHVYREVANGNFDAVVHVGDYIYEYKSTGYASEDATSLGRVVDPLNEIVSLSDYRLRYAQYHTDADLQAAHASAPFICIWDDHEIANDSWKDGAENHNDGEGLYSDRRIAALKAYYEWLPIRPPSVGEGDIDNLQRRFTFGNLVDLVMVDTRHFAREQPLYFTDFTDPLTHMIDDVALRTAIAEPRDMLGGPQLDWLVNQLGNSVTRWQVLGQQVLMARMMIPAPIMAAINSVDITGGLSAINDAVAAKNTVEADRTQEQIDLLASVVPYNLDAWDGYAVEREELFDAVATLGSKLIVLAGDTHNAWGNQLRRANGDIVGVELATSSVSSPGLEYYLGIGSAVTLLEPSVKTLVDDLKYINLLNRGYLDITFSSDSVTANWRFVSTVKDASYVEALDRNGIATIDHETLTLNVS